MASMFFNLVIINLLQSGINLVDHTAIGGPKSWHVIVVGLSGMRSPLQEYSISSPARNWPLMSVGVVCEFAGGVGGSTQTKHYITLYISIGNTL